MSSDHSCVVRTHHCENFRSQSSEPKNISETVFRNFRNRLANQQPIELSKLNYGRRPYVSKGPGGVIYSSDGEGSFGQVAI